MVPYSQRRHRINPQEIEPILEACAQRLIHFLSLSIHDSGDLQEAGSLFRVYYRLNEHVMSRPSYPPHETWDEIAVYLDNGSVSKEENL